LLIQSTSFESGGAAIAAKRWVEALEIEKVRCQSSTAKNSITQRVINKVTNYLFWSEELASYRGPISLSLIGEHNSRDSKFYFTHWVQNGFLSLFQLSRQAKKTIWYLHDEWLLLGTGHYRDRYKLDSRLPAVTLFLDLLLRKWKFRYLIKPALGICVPSKWMEVQLINSGVSAAQIKVIPNPIPELFFNSPGKAASRQKLDLGINEKIILVIASSTSLDKRKGIDLIEPTMAQINKSDSNYRLITVGIDGFDLNPKGINHKTLGHVGSEHDLVNLYASADVLFVPSRLDNLPQVITEAQSLGLPVVAFDVGGISEAILFPELSGKIIEPFSIKKAADAILFFLDSSNGITDQDWATEASRRWSNSKIKIEFVQYLDNLIVSDTTAP
jgi:glycosyltransferase involved in cell wall biosynthesis